MLKIRLARGGAKKRPYYHIVVADSHSPRDGRFIEKVGAYNPLLKKDDPNRVVLKTEAIEGWLKKGAQPTIHVSRVDRQRASTYLLISVREKDGDTAKLRLRLECGFQPVFLHIETAPKAIR